MAGRLATINLPDFLERPTGVFICDVMPCVTLLVTIPTINLYYRSKRHWDVIHSVVAATLAMIFHMCHMHVDGIQAASYFGIDGPTWRTLDVIAAQLLLARTVAHAIGDQHPFVASIPNVLLPAVHLYNLFSKSRWVVG